MDIVEKVLKGLKFCKDEDSICIECPYFKVGETESECMRGALMPEAISVIRLLENENGSLKKINKAHWIFGASNGHGWMKCSKCNVSQDGQTACWTYCPNCGAYMIEE